MPFKALVSFNDKPIQLLDFKGEYIILTFNYFYYIEELYLYQDLAPVINAVNLGKYRTSKL